MSAFHEPLIRPSIKNITVLYLTCLSTISLYEKIAMELPVYPLYIPQNANVMHLSQLAY